MKSITKHMLSRKILVALAVVAVCVCGAVLFIVLQRSQKPPQEPQILRAFPSVRSGVFLGYVIVGTEVVSDEFTLISCINGTFRLTILETKIRDTNVLLARVCLSYDYVITTYCVEKNTSKRSQYSCEKTIILKFTLDAIRVSMFFNRLYLNESKLAAYGWCAERLNVTIGNTTREVMLVFRNLISEEWQNRTCYLVDAATGVILRYLEENSSRKRKYCLKLELVLVDTNIPLS